MKRRHYFILIFVVGLMITGCGSKEEEIKETVDSTVEEILVEDILVEDILVEETIVSDEYLEELEYNSQKNSWGINVPSSFFLFQNGIRGINTPFYGRELKGGD